MTRRVAPSINLIPDGDKMHRSQQMIINVCTLFSGVTLFCVFVIGIGFLRNYFHNHNKLVAQAIVVNFIYCGVMTTAKVKNQ